MLVQRGALLAVDDAQLEPAAQGEVERRGLVGHVVVGGTSVTFSFHSSWWLLNTTHGERASMSAKPGCSIAWTISSVRALVLKEAPRATNEAPEAMAKASVLSGCSRLPYGVEGAF